MAKKPNYAVPAGKKKPPAWAAGTGWGDYGAFAPGTADVFGQGQTDYTIDPVVADPNYDWTQQPWGGIGPAPGAGGSPSPGGPGKWLNIPGFMPDYMGNIGSDPEYLAALNDINLADQASETGTAEGINQLAVGFGGDLSSLLSQGLISQETAQRAGQNEFSTMKELGRALSRGNEGTASRLAASGTLNSGALDVMRSQLQEGYQRQSTTATNELLNRVKGMQMALGQGKAERRASLQGVRSSVGGRLAQQAMSQARPAMRARWNQDLNAYEAPNGTLWDQNGNPISGY